MCLPPNGPSGLVFQDYLLFPHLTVRDNVAFGPNAQGRGADVDHWLERFGLSELADRRPGELSGGEARGSRWPERWQPSRLRCCSTSRWRPSMPPRERSFVDTWRTRCPGFAGPRLLVTHDPADAVLLADEMVILESGVIVQRGTPEEIRLRPQSAYAADLAGVNFVRGEAASGNVTVEGHVLRVGDTSIGGPVIATIHPRAISLHRSEPEGSPRNAWQTRVERVEHYGDRVRIETGSPLAVTAEVTPSALADLGLGREHTCGCRSRRPRSASREPDQAVRPVCKRACNRVVVRSGVFSLGVTE